MVVSLVVVMVEEEAPPLFTILYLAPSREIQITPKSRTTHSWTVGLVTLTVLVLSQVFSLSPNTPETHNRLVMALASSTSSSVSPLVVVPFQFWSISIGEDEERWD